MLGVGAVVIILAHLAFGTLEVEVEVEVEVEGVGD